MIWFIFPTRTPIGLISVVALFNAISSINSHQPNSYETRDSLSPIAKFPLSSNNQALVQNGKQEYELLLEKKKNTIYGQCWANAILKLERNCNQLDEYRQSWLSILFTYCFLKTSGLGVEFLGDKCLDVIKSDEYESFTEMIPQVKECTRNIDLKIFHSYSLFFVHTQSICFYLQSEQWQKNTENLVDNLVHSAQVVSTDLNSAVDNIRQLEVLQNSSLKAQLFLNEELAQAKQSLSKFQEQTKEQRDLIEKIIVQFHLLKEFLVVEFSTNSAFIYYIFAMIVIYFVTTPQRTIGVRLILYLILAANFFLEKKFLDYLIKFGFLINLDNNLNGEFNLTTHLWIIRKIMLFIMTCTYIWWAVSYLDISQMNYKILNDNTMLLKSIQKKLNENSSTICNYSEYSDQSDHSSGEDTYSNYDSDSVSDSVISTDSDISPDDNFQDYNPRYYLRTRSHLQSPQLTKLPDRYRNESINQFVRNIRSAPTTEQLNFYSSDEN